MKFNCVISNPPYQNSNGGGSIYPDFFNKCYRFSDEYIIFICPDRWVFSNKDKAITTMRNNVIKSNNLDKLVHIISNKGESFVFEGASPNDLTYFLVDKDKNSGCYSAKEFDPDGVLLESSTLNLSDFYFSRTCRNIFKKISEKCCENMKGITCALSHSEVDTLDSVKSSPVKNNECTLKVYGNGGSFAYVPESVLRNDYSLYRESYKVLLARNGVGATIAEPDTLASRSCYMIRLGSKDEAENCRSYLETKFFRFLLKVLKNGIVTPVDAFEKIPRLDFDKAWDDKAVVKYFGFNENEADYISMLSKYM